MKKTISHEEISSLCTELSMLLHAGVTVGDALALLAEEADTDWKKLLTALAGDVDSGLPLSSAIRNAEVFPSYVCGLIEAGEQAGRLEEALNALAVYYENRTRLNKHIRRALLYPAVMLLLMLVVIAVILVKVLPVFNDVYASLGGQLTGVAGGLLTFGECLGAAMPVLWILLVILALFVTAFSAIASFRAKILTGWKKGMGDRGIFRRMNNARLAQALAMGTASGLPIEDSLTLAAGLMEDVPAAKARSLDCRDKLDSGMSLSEAMEKSGLLPPAKSRLLEISRKSGSEDTAMDKIARDLIEESETELEDKIGRIEPALVLVCSVLVGLILLSVMLPLTHIMTVIG